MTTVVSGMLVAVEMAVLSVGRFACVAKIVDPSWLTSAMAELVAGAVPAEILTAEMVSGAPVSLYQRIAPTAVAATPAMVKAAVTGSGGLAEVSSTCTTRSDAVPSVASTSTVRYAPSASVTLPGTAEAVCCPTGIDGSLPAAKIDAPLTLTSTVSGPVAGAVPAETLTPVIARAAPVSLYQRAVPVTVPSAPVAHRVTATTTVVAVPPAEDAAPARSVVPATTAPGDDASNCFGSATRDSFRRLAWISSHGRFGWTGLAIRTRECRQPRTRATSYPRPPGRVRPPSSAGPAPPGSPRRTGRKAGRVGGKQVGGVAAGTAPRDSGGDPADALQRLIQDWLDAERGRSLRQFATICGLSPSTLYAIMDEDRPMIEPPRTKTINGMARGLGIPASIVKKAVSESVGYSVEDISDDPDLQILIAIGREISPAERRRLRRIAETFIADDPETRMDG